MSMSALSSSSPRRYSYRIISLQVYNLISRCAEIAWNDEPGFPEYAGTAAKRGIPKMIKFGNEAATPKYKPEEL